jgi:superfamily II DNA or RNA helicase
MSTLPLFDRPALMDVKATELRPYQARLIERVRAHVVAGRKRVLMVAPCGAGKMYVIANIIRTSTLPVLFLCHRQELINQCANELARLGVSRIGVIRGDDERVDPGAPTQLASIQTIMRRRHKPEAGIIICDEAHRVMSDSYQDLLALYPGAIVLGATATPTRLDGKPLGNTFDALEVAATYQELIKAKHIYEPECWGAAVAPDLSQVRTRMGEYEEGALAEVMAPLTGGIVERWLERAHMYKLPGVMKYQAGPRRRTVVFAVNLAHAAKLVDEFSKVAKTALLDGSTPDGDRVRILQSIASGELEVVVNCNVLLEGTDVPAIKCVVHARPTQSLVLYRQSTGRTMRPWNDVTPLLLDHAGNFERHGAPHDDMVWSLTREPVRVKPSAHKICKTCFAYVAVSLTLCPHCGTDFPKSAPKPPREVAGEMVQKDTTPEGIRRAYFDAMVKKAKERGFKPGYASAMHKERYGEWPPYAWSDAVKADFAGDPYWQRSLERRLREKEETKPVPIEREVVDMPEENFADWWESQ